ncbi:MAG TPA: transposase, partial [Acidobacteriota bacterium]|nr:transposase [Acidobacteriota bacterium]
MRGENRRQQQGAFSYVSIEERIPADHPIRRMRLLVDGILKRLGGEFDRLYSDTGRPSIAPEKLLRAMLLQLLYGVRSER